MAAFYPAATIGFVLFILFYLLFLQIRLVYHRVDLSFSPATFLATGSEQKDPDPDGQDKAILEIV